MASLLITNIRTLVNVRAEYHLLRGAGLAELPCIDDAYLLIEDNEIVEYGRMEDLARNNKGEIARKGAKAQSNPGAFAPLREASSSENVFDASGRFVLPTWCDSHTHLVFAASRENEFIDKLKGLSYAEIAARGGGILNSAKKLRETSEDELFRLAWQRLQEVSSLGTGAIEIKSGYGLNVDGELKMLRVIKKLKEKSRLPIKATFLGAHSWPPEYKDDHQGYINLIIDKMLPVIAAEKLADYIDVFCETNFFSPEDTATLISAGRQYGLKAKIHANQLNLSGGVQTGVAHGALTVDHLETMDDSAISALAGSNTIGTLLPTAAFFLRMPFQPARQLIEAGCAIALASDYNPGSSPSGNMNLVVAMSCIQMRMLPEEAINAATINGAYAMELENEVGTITAGKKANLIVTKPVPSLAYLPYSFGSSLIDKVMIGGEWL